VVEARVIRVHAAPPASPAHHSPHRPSWWCPTLRPARRRCCCRYRLVILFPGYHVRVRAWSTDTASTPTRLYLAPPARPPGRGPGPLALCNGRPTVGVRVSPNPPLSLARSLAPPPAPAQGVSHLRAAAAVPGPRLNAPAPRSRPPPAQVQGGGGRARPPRARRPLPSSWPRFCFLPSVKVDRVKVDRGTMHGLTSAGARRARGAWDA
jgi:hypothetical protein